MRVNGMSEHCPDCTDRKACGNYHVYVIELKKNVLKLEPSFPFEGELARGKRVYYVGQTKHSVECRYKQHVAPRHKKSRTGFNCNCFTEDIVLMPFRPQNAPGEYVNEHHKKGGLRPEWHYDENPAVDNKIETYPGMMEDLRVRAEEEEEDLALDLRAKGHAVHYN